MFRFDHGGPAGAHTDDMATSPTPASSQLIGGVPIGRVRAWWAHRQGLDGGLAGAPAAEALARTGWARSVGGAAPYLGLFARVGLEREAVDAAVARLDVHELPSARGCTYVLPRTDYALGLTLGAGAPEGELAAAEKHLGVRRAEIDRLCGAVADALDAAGGPLDPAAIKDATGGAVRSLGEGGRKRGLTTTLPLALGLLQARGEIRRVPLNGRLDQQRYAYARWSPSPLAGFGLDREQVQVELARRYFDWAAPASLRHFRWFSGLTAAAAKAAVEPLGLVPLGGTDLLLPPDLAEEFAGYREPEEPAYSLLSAIDGLHLLRRDLPLLIDPADAQRPVPGAKVGRVFGGEADPPCHIVVDRGRIVGFWEYDTQRHEIVHQLFASRAAVFEDVALEAAIARTEAFVREQLGDARGFSLDSPKSRAPKITAMRQAQQAL